MSEPVTSAGATAAVAGVSILSLLPSVDAGVVMGAFAGSIVFIITNPQYRWPAKIGLFIASFATGLIAATEVASFINSSTPDSVMPGSPVGALVASAIAVKALTYLMDKLTVKQGASDD